MHRLFDRAFFCVAQSCPGYLKLFGKTILVVAQNGIDCRVCILQSSIKFLAQLHVDMTGNELLFAMLSNSRVADAIAT